MAIASNIIGVLAGLVYVFGLQFEKRQYFLIAIICANVLFSTSYFMCSAISGAIMGIIAIVMTIINFFFRNKKIPIWLICIYIAVNLTAGALSYKNYIDVLTIIAPLLFIASITITKGKYARPILLIYTILWTVYAILTVNYGALISNILILISGIAAIIRHDLRPIFHGKKYGAYKDLEKNETPNELTKNYEEPD